ncbi:unnamed protein product [Pylaiella littoralis]
MTSEEASSKEILCYGFNQDATCLAVGLRTGYRIYTCRPFAQCFAMTDGGIARAEMLFSSSLVALVGSGDRPAFSPRRLCLWNTKKDHSICEVNFITAVLAVKLNRKRVAVCLNTALHVFDISDMKCLRTLETAANPDGVMALSPNEENCHLAFPDGTRSGSPGGGGEVILYDALDLKVLNKVVACRSRVVAVSFSRDGKLLATASEQGTVIRIFTVPGAVKMYTLRRGTTSCDIYSMSFNAAATRLAVSSSTRTIHIFDVSAGGMAVSGGERGRSERRPSSTSTRQGGSGSSWAAQGQGQEGDAESGGNTEKNRRRGSGNGDDAAAGGSGGSSGSSSSSSRSLASGLRSVVGMLPNRVTKRMQDYVDCERSFASIRLRSSAGRSICALIPAGDSGVWTGRKGPSGGAAAGGEDGNDSGGQEEQEVEGEMLLVVTSEGILYSYIVDTVNGGECRLDEASSLLMDPSASQEIGSELFGPERHAPPIVAERN